MKLLPAYYNQGLALAVGKSTKLGKIVFPMECFTAYFLRFSCTNVKN